MLEKITRRIKALKISLNYFNKVKQDPSLIDWFQNDLPELKKFINKHLGEDCFIICNGPSLNNTNLNLLNDYNTIGLNKIFLIFDKYKFDLDYLIAINPLVIEQSMKEYENMDIPVFLPKVSARAKHAHIHYIQTGGYFSFATTFDEKISEGYTVTFAALQIAYIMGFKRVFIVGADHYFKQEGKPNSEQTLKVDDENHFHPDYFKGQKWHLADIAGNEIAYRVARKVYETSHREIYNATVGGHLEIFERMSYAEALSIAKKKRSKFSVF